MVITLILAVMLPLTANAATITAAEKKGKSEATIGEVIDVVVKLDEKEVESMQFDLKYDNQKFKYVQESAKSKLDSTLSHEIEPGVVRVSVIDNKNDGKTDNEVTMQFEAIGEGKNAQFTVVDGSVEVGKTSGKISEKVKNPTATIATVFTNTGNNNGQGGGNPAPVQQYVNDQGQVITALPKTGEEAKAGKILSINGTYSTLGNLQNVVPYAFQTSDVTLDLDSIKAEFGNNITTTVSGIAKTGDTITVDGITYTIIIYGDVNGDGKVTTYDALLAKKIKLGKLTNISEFAREAANVEKSAIDTTAMQKFILRLRKTATDTILDKFPTKPEAPISKVDAIEVQPSSTGGLRFDEIIVATMKSITPNEELIEGIIKNIVKDANGNDASAMLKAVPSETEEGVWNLVFTPTIAGTYTINPIVKVGNQTIVDEAYKALTVTVNEATTVTDVELYSGSTKVETSANNRYVIRDGKNVEFTLKYIHKYANGTEVVLNPENKTSVAPEKLSLTTSNDTNGVLNADATSFWDVNGTQILYDNQTGLPTQGRDHVQKLVVQSIRGTSGNADLTITVDNKDGSIPITLPVYITVEEPTVTGIKLDGNETTTYNLDLYTELPTGNNKVQKIGNDVYTIIDLALVTQFEDIKLVYENLKLPYNATDKSFVVREVSDDSGYADDILCAGFVKSGDTYTQTQQSTAEISAIGIAFSGKQDFIINNVINGGLTFEYAGLTVTVNVTKKDVPTTTANVSKAPAKAPAKLPEACVHEKDAGTVTKEATCVEAGTMTYKCTKCGEVVETIAIKALGHNYKDGKCTVCEAVENKDGNTTKPSTNTTNTDKPSTSTNTTGENKTPETPVVPPCEHEKDVSSGKITKMPTCSEEGEAEYTCKKCGEVIKEPLGKASHNYGEDGKCTVCGEADPNYVAPVAPSEPVEEPAKELAPETPAA